MLSELVFAQKENFMAENHPSSKYPKQYIKNLYSSGLAAQLAFGKRAKEKTNEIEKSTEEDKKNANTELFRKTIIQDIKENNTIDQNIFNPEEELLNLFKLLCFIQAWADSEETWDIHNSDEFEKKKIRQSMKFKKDIDKSIRRSIHVGLFKSVAESLLRFKQLTENGEDPYLETLLNELERFGSTKTSLINVIKKFLDYKSFEPASENIKGNFLEAAKLISTFTLWPDKIFYGCGIGIGLIAALACGISTGGAIFILLVSFGLPFGFVIPLSALIFLASTRANFQLFSKHIPQFLQDLCSGRVTEFINEQGKRLQLSPIFIMTAFFFSVSVGIATAATTVLEGTKMIALICPMLGVACPYLPGILLGILASALLVGLAVVMFRAFIGLKSWKEIKDIIKEKWEKLNLIKILTYLLVMVAALFGLGFLSIAGAPALAPSIGWIAAYGISIFAFFGDVPFTLVTGFALCTSLLAKNDSSPNITKNIGYYLGKIVEFFALMINALGNAALVFANSWIGPR